MVSEVPNHAKLLYKIFNNSDQMLCSSNGYTQKQFTGRTNIRFLVCHDKESPKEQFVGALIYEMLQPNWLVQAVYVEGEYQKTGLARLMVSELIGRAHLQKIPKIGLYGCHQALNFFKKCNFTVQD